MINGIKQPEPEDGFIKTSERPLSALNSEQKAKLNRRGNELYNNHDIMAAERMKKNDKLTALKFYHLAHNKAKEGFILDELAALVRLFL